MSQLRLLWWGEMGVVGGSRCVAVALDKKQTNYTINDALDGCLWLQLQRGTPLLSQAPLRHLYLLSTPPKALLYLEVG